MYIGLHVRYPLFLSDFNETRIFSTVIRKILKHKISRKSVHWEPNSVWVEGRTDGRTDGRIDMTQLRVAFSQFCDLASTCNCPSA